MYDVELLNRGIKENGRAWGWGTVSDFREMAKTLERELNAANERITRLEEDLMDAKNQYAALVADVVLYEDRGERIKRLEEALTAIELAMKQPASNHRLMQIAGPARQVINIIKKAKEDKP